MPTPTAGTATLLAPPVPNPVPFVAAQGQTLLSGQYNSNFFALWNYATLLASALNGCTFVPGGAVASVTPTYPISAAVGACSAGVGAALTLSLAHGDYLDLANAQTVAGTKTFGAIALSAPLAIASGGTGSATQNFVDLSTAQSILGTKTFLTDIYTQRGTGGSSALGAVFLGDQSAGARYVYNNGTNYIFAALPIVVNGIASSGVITSLASGGPTVAGNLAPLYTSTGTAAGTSAHQFFVTSSCSTNTGGNCQANPSLAAAVAFSAANSYACRGDFISPGVIGGYIQVTNISATQIAQNVIGATPSTTINWVTECIGT